MVHLTNNHTCNAWHTYSNRICNVDLHLNVTDDDNIGGNTIYIVTLLTLSNVRDQSIKIWNRKKKHEKSFKTMNCHCLSLG